MEHVNSLVTFALCPREANSGNLQPLYEFVQEALKPMDSGEAAWRCPVLLVDDLSVLLSLGVGAVAVLDFIHYCRATVCREWKVITGLLPVLLPVTRTGRQAQASLVCSDLFCLIAWGFGFTLAGPGTFQSTHLALHYLLLMKNKALKTKRVPGTVFNGAGHLRY